MQRYELFLNFEPHAYGDLPSEIGIKRRKHRVTCIEDEMGGGYLQLTLVEAKSESLTRILLHDRFVQRCILRWLAAFFVISYYRLRA